jgi:hypothetical protein
MITSPMKEPPLRAAATTTTTKIRRRILVARTIHWLVLPYP